MTMTFARKSRVAAALALALGMSSAAVAQETSSSMRGKIVGPEGNPAANTKIVLIHQPSGTVRELTTNESGAFLAKGLRVGGPYTVIVDSDTFRDKVEEGLSLTLGETYRFNVQLEAVQEDMERIVVTGSIPVTTTGGANSSFGVEDIENLPSFNRDVKDIARLNPLVSISGSNGQMSVAGSNPRGNSFTVDGIGQNDDFGLNYGGYPTEQPPVSLDAIEQVSVDVAPFSAKKGGFTGAQINAVTKSGTNEFKGALFFETMQPSWSGDIVQPDQKFAQETRTGRDGSEYTVNVPVLRDGLFRTFDENEAQGNEKTQTFGLSLGGPIIQDKLFFFTAYDQWKRVLEMDYGFEGSGAANEFNVTQGQLDQFLNILEDTYGLTDSIGGNPEDNDRKWLTKLSWNISDAHRMDLTYQWQDNKDARQFATGGNTVNLNSRRYIYHTRTSNISSKLYSDWNDDFSTEIGVSYKDVTAATISNSDFGAVKVSFTDDLRAESVAFGRDSVRHNNLAKNETIKLAFDANYLYGEHDIRFGLHAERLSLYNLFARNSLGTWEYAGLEDFANKDVSRFSYSNAYSGDAQDTAFEVKRTTLALYIEDSMPLTDDLDINFGVRYERLFSSDVPKINTRVENTYGIDNQENLDGLDIILPRLGFTWYATDELKVRGGIGRFYGGLPNVWYTNPFSNDGLTYVSATRETTDNYFSTNEADFRQVPEAISGSLVQGAGSTNFTDPNFELPSDWRAQLAFDYEFSLPYLGENYSWTNELMYVRRQDEAIWIDRTRVAGNYLADGQRQLQTSVYANDPLLQDNYDIMLTNSDETSRSVVFTTSLAKRWDSGFDARLSYTNQDVTEVVAGSSSSADGNYAHNVAINRNEYFESTGSYEVEHTFKLTLGYKTEFFEGYETRINLFFERRSGQPFSWKVGMFNDFDLGDQDSFGSTSGYLPYIPTGADDPNVAYAGGLDYEQLSQVIQSAGLESYAGGFAPKNVGRQPWVTSLDLNIQQDIPGFMDGHKGIFYFTIDNLANLLNKDWGQEYRFTYPQQSLYDLDSINEDGQYVIRPVYNGFDTRNYNSVVTNASVWRIKMGIRYTF